MAMENKNYTYLETAAGQLTILSSDSGIHSAYFTDANETLANHIFMSTVDTKKLLLRGTSFQIKVWQAAMQIPAGKTITYKELAEHIGLPKTFRAVANALGQNKIAYLIPCHRVIRTDGGLGGYKWGIERKKKLLEIEKQSFKTIV